MAKALKNKLDTAYKAVLDNASLGVTVYAGFGNSDKAAPCVIVNTISAEEEPVQSGNWNCTTEIDVKTIPDDTTAQDTLASAVRDALWTTTLETDLNNQGQDIHVFGTAAAARLDWLEVEDCQVERLTILTNTADNDLQP